MVRPVSHLILGALLLAGLLVPSEAGAANYPCTEAGLEQALATGGDAAFACNGSQTITLTKEVDPSRFVSKNVTLRSGTGYLTISGDDRFRILVVNSGVTLTLRTLTLTRAATTDASIGGARGSAIFINQGGRVEMDNVFVTNSRATSGTNQALGGAILNGKGTLIVTQSTFEGNQAIGPNASGGAIYSDTPGLADIRTSRLTGNRAQNSSNGVAEGGALSAKSTMNLVDSFLDNNVALNGGTGTARGGAVAASAQSGARSEIFNTFIQNNTAESTGSGGEAVGGGVYNDPTGNLLVSLGAIQSNLARSAAGGGKAFGGGLYSAGGSAVVRSSTLANNSSEGAANGTTGGSALVAAAGTVDYLGSVLSPFQSQPLCFTPAPGTYRSLGGNVLASDTCPTVPSDVSPLQMARLTIAIATNASVSTAPTAAGQGGLTLNVVNNGTAPQSATVANLPPTTFAQANPLIGQDGAGLIGEDGASLAQVNLIGQDGAGLIGQDGASLVDESALSGRAPQALGDAASMRFYYSSANTGAAEANMNLFYWNGNGWAPVYSSGPSLPAKDTTDNLDGTVSGGRFSVTFDASSRPTADQLGSVRIASIQGTVPPPTFRVLLPTAQKGVSAE
ncbi:MAG: hypothetical protein U0556_12995 [Dehalococcoidia bacterium]